MKSVLIPLAQGCEELEAVTIIDLLRRADITVVVAGLDDRPVTCSRNTVIMPDTTLEQVLDQSFDLIVLPGGQPGTDNLNNDERIIKLLKKQAADKQLIAAICAAPKILAKAGLLNNKKATGYPGILNKLGLTDTTITNAAIEHDANIITSRGPGTAMEFALYLIELLIDSAARQTIAQQLT